MLCNSRAILGQENDDGSYSVYPMSNEHNVDNINEVKRLFSEHPANEQTGMIRDGRLLE